MIRVSDSSTCFRSDLSSEYLVTRLLLEHGTDVEVEDKSGRTPLQIASWHWQLHDEITKYLKVGTRKIESN